jgi:hypothetical protein
MHESVLVYKGLKFLKWGVVLIAASFLGYIFHDPVPIANGGTTLGYVLGTIGALLILWLMWFGVRKRRYGGGGSQLEGWLSAHIYLGTSLIIVATLHTGFQFGWNVHTLAYALMMIVIFSGFFGVYAYRRYPQLMTENMQGDTLPGTMAAIVDIDDESKELSITLSDEISGVIFRGAQETKIGGSFMAQLSASDRGCAAHRAFEETQNYTASTPSGKSGEMTKLLSLLGRKTELVAKARRDVRLKALMNIWLYFHVPLSLALLSALSAHVFSIFFYW